MFEYKINWSFLDGMISGKLQIMEHTQVNQTAQHCPLQRTGHLSQQHSPSHRSARAYSKRVPRTNCALLIKKCAPRISSGIYFLSTS